MDQTNTGVEKRVSKNRENRKNGADDIIWPQPHIITIPKSVHGFGFTLRHFVVYPPKSANTKQLEQNTHTKTDPKSSPTNEALDTIFVKTVKDGSCASTSGLTTGDRIVSINGEYLTGKSYQDVIGLIQNSGDPLQLLVVPKKEDILQTLYPFSVQKHDSIRRKFARQSLEQLNHKRAEQRRRFFSDADLNINNNSDTNRNSIYQQIFLNSFHDSLDFGVDDSINNSYNNSINSEVTSNRCVSKNDANYADFSPSEFVKQINDSVFDDNVDVNLSPVNHSLDQSSVFDGNIKRNNLSSRYDDSFYRSRVTPPPSHMPNFGLHYSNPSSEELSKMERRSRLSQQRSEARKAALAQYVEDANTFTPRPNDSYAISKNEESTVVSPRNPPRPTSEYTRAQTTSVLPYQSRYSDIPSKTDFRSVRSVSGSNLGERSSSYRNTRLNKTIGSYGSISPYETSSSRSVTSSRYPTSSTSTPLATSYSSGIHREPARHSSALSYLTRTSSEDVTLRRPVNVTSPVSSVSPREYTRPSSSYSVTHSPAYSDVSPSVTSPQSSINTRRKRFEDSQSSSERSFETKLYTLELDSVRYSNNTTPTPETTDATDGGSSSRPASRPTSRPNSGTIIPINVRQSPESDTKNTTPIPLSDVSQSILNTQVQNRFQSPKRNSGQFQISDASGGQMYIVSPPEKDAKPFTPRERQPKVVPRAIVKPSDPSPFGTSFTTPPNRRAWGSGIPPFANLVRQNNAQRNERTYNSVFVSPDKRQLGTQDDNRMRKTLDFRTNRPLSDTSISHKISIQVSQDHDVFSNRKPISSSQSVDFNEHTSTLTPPNNSTEIPMSESAEIPYFQSPSQDNTPTTIPTQQRKTTIDVSVGSAPSVPQTSVLKRLPTKPDDQSSPSIPPKRSSMSELARKSYTNETNRKLRMTDPSASPFSKKTEAIPPRSSSSKMIMYLSTVGSPITRYGEALPHDALPTPAIAPTQPTTVSQPTMAMEVSAARATVLHYTPHNTAPVPAATTYPHYPHSIGPPSLPTTPSPHSVQLQPTLPSVQSQLDNTNSPHSSVYCVPPQSEREITPPLNFVPQVAVSPQNITMPPQPIVIHTSNIQSQPHKPNLITVTNTNIQSQPNVPTVIIQMHPGNRSMTIPVKTTAGPPLHNENLVYHQSQTSISSVSQPMYNQTQSLTSTNVNIQQPYNQNQTITHTQSVYNQNQSTTTQPIYKKNQSSMEKYIFNQKLQQHTQYTQHQPTMAQITYTQPMSNQNPPTMTQTVTNRNQPTVSTWTHPHSKVATVQPVILRKKLTDAEEELLKFHRRTSYLMATSKERTTLSPTREVPPLRDTPPRDTPPRDTPPRNTPPRQTSSQEIVPPPTYVPPQFNAPPSYEIETPPKDQSFNKNKLKQFFGEKTPSIVAAVDPRSRSHKSPTPVPDICKESYLCCKLAISDGKRAHDRSWKIVWAMLRGHLLYLLKEKKDISVTTPLLVEEQPISIKSCLVDIANDYTKKKHVFRLRTYNGSEYLLQADDGDEMSAWITAIQRNNDPDGDEGGVGMADLIARKTTQYETSTASKTSPQTTHKQHKQPSILSKAKMTYSPSLRRKSKLHADDAKTKEQKETRTWKGKLGKSFKRFGGSHVTVVEEEPTPCSGTFGVPLEHCQPSPDNEAVPLIVEICTKIVEIKGLEMIGIYRVPGNIAAVTAMIDELNLGVEHMNSDNDKWFDLNVIGSLLKAFFRKLPEPLVTHLLYESFIAANRIQNPMKRMLSLKRLFHELPEHHFETFHHIALHLARVAAMEHKNKMDAKNLAIVFGPTLVRRKVEDAVGMVADMCDQCRIIETVIKHHEWIFSSWDVDSYVPTGVPGEMPDEQHRLSVSSIPMDDEYDREVDTRFIVASIIQAANRKVKDTKDKMSISCDNLGGDSSIQINERNIDNEVAKRKAKSHETLNRECLSVVNLNCSLPTGKSMEQLDSQISYAVCDFSMSSKSCLTDSYQSLPSTPDWSVLTGKSYTSSSHELSFSSCDLLNNENDELKISHGSVASLSGHDTLSRLKRIEEEARALRVREEQRQQEREKRRVDQQRIEKELQRTRHELEMEDSQGIDDLICQTHFAKQISDYTEHMTDLNTGLHDKFDVVNENAYSIYLVGDAVDGVVTKTDGRVYEGTILHQRTAVLNAETLRASSMEAISPYKHRRDKFVKVNDNNSLAVPNADKRTPSRRNSRRSSLDSLRDFYDKDRRKSWASEDSEDGSDLLTSLTTTFDQKLQILLNPKYRLNGARKNSRSDESFSGSSRTDTSSQDGDKSVEKNPDKNPDKNLPQSRFVFKKSAFGVNDAAFRDPSLHRTYRPEAKIGIASRFERGSSIPVTPTVVQLPTMLLNSKNHDSRIPNLKFFAPLQLTDPPRFNHSQSNESPQLQSCMKKPHENIENLNGTNSEGDNTVRRFSKDDWRRHTVGGIDDMEHIKALKTFDKCSRPSAWDQLCPAVKRNSIENTSLVNWLHNERVRISQSNVSFQLANQRSLSSSCGNIDHLYHD